MFRGIFPTVNQDDRPTFPSDLFYLGGSPSQPPEGIFTSAAGFEIAGYKMAVQYGDTIPPGIPNDIFLQGRAAPDQQEDRANRSR